MKTPGRLLLACALLVASSAQAQDVTCEPDDTVNTCIDRLVTRYSRTLRAGSNEIAEADAVNATPENKKTAADKQSKAAANAANNEAETKDQPGTATAGEQATSGFTDLIPWLNMVGLLSDSDESDGTIALDLNFLLFKKKKEAKHDSQLKWEFDVSPTLFEPLALAIPEDVRDERSKALQEDIDDTADSTLLYTYSVINKSLGRDFRQHQKEFQLLIAPRILSANLAAGSDQVNTAFDLKRAAFGAEQQSLVNGIRRPTNVAEEEDKADVAIRLFTADERARINEFVNKARNGYAQELAARLDAKQRAVSDSRIYGMAELVLQQPQLLITATKSIRSELVGPESWGAKVTFEKSLVDFNSFKKYAKENTAPDGKTKRKDMCKIFDSTVDAVIAESVANGSTKASDTCLDALADYVSTNAEQIENNSRWKAALEYKQVDDWAYALPDDGVNLDLPKHDRLIASAGFGRAIQRSAAKDRVDFEVAYDSNMDDDDTYNSRFVATLTYTRRFMDMDMPISIVYANKSEFLGDTDKQIGMHIGIKYRALDKEK